MEYIHIDLFAGSGGFHKGLLEAGFKFSGHYFSEIDKHAIANYLYNFPNSIHAGDIRFISGTEIRAKHPNAKFIITFGFPCQDLSVAGKGAGFDGKRSVLFFEAIRLIKEFGEQCEIFIFENVKGLLSHNEGETFEIVLRTIADIGLYECEWQLLNTAWLLPQNRERIYFIGHLAGRSKCRVFPITKNDFRTNERPTKAIVNTLTAGGHSGGMHSSMTLICDSGQGRKLEERKILAPLRSNTGSGHGNYVFYGNSQDQKLSLDISQTINAGHYNVPKILNHHLRSSKLNKGGTGPLESDTNCFCLDSTPHIVNNIRRLTEIECERLQGFQDNWTKYGIYNGKVKEISKTQRYKLMGNAVTVAIVKLIGDRLV